MTRQKRRRYTREFKEQAVKLAARGDQSIAQIARNLGIHPNVLYHWIKQVRDHADSVFPGNGKVNPYEEENRILRKRLADAEEERDILKKAMAIFSRRPK